MGFQLLIPSIHGDPPLEAQVRLLSEAIQEALVKTGMVKMDALLDGPQLLMGLQDLTDHYLELTGAKNVV